MILVDTGPLVALFDPAEAWHQRCVTQLKKIREPIVTTVPVLTEAFHLLTPNSPGAQGLMDFVADTGLAVWFLDHENLNLRLSSCSDTPTFRWTLRMPRWLPRPRLWKRGQSSRSIARISPCIGCVGGIGTSRLKYWDDRSRQCVAIRHAVLASACPKPPHRACELPSELRRP